MEKTKENNSLLRAFLEERQLSQRGLAEKCGISRGRLQRLENGQFETATYQELKQIAQALGISVQEIFRVPVPEGPPNGVHLRRHGEDALQYEGRGGGHRIFSLMSPREDFFIGKLFLSPQNRIPADETPRARTVFLQALIGTLHVELNGKTYQVQEGDRLVFDGPTPYVLINPSLREQISLLITSPAFPFG